MRRGSLTCKKCPLGPIKASQASSEGRLWFIACLKNTPFAPRWHLAYCPGTVWLTACQRRRLHRPRFHRGELPPNDHPICALCGMALDADHPRSVLAIARLRRYGPRQLRYRSRHTLPNKSD